MQVPIEEKIELKAGLYVVSTPIGNYYDMTFRAVNVLKACDVIFCEDTRVSEKLLKFFKIPKKPLFIYNEHSVEKDRKKVLKFIEGGKSVALVSDAGTPLISDPGYKLVKDCYQNGFYVTPVPGVSSVVVALSASGLPTDEFGFYGFLPPKKEQRRKRLKNLKDKTETLVLFETANRLLSSLEDCLEILGDRNICVARELTKLYEEIKLNKISWLINYYKNSILKGEIVLVIEGCNKSAKSTIDIASVERDLKEAMDRMRLKDAVDLISGQNDLHKKQVYQLALKLKNINK